MRFGVGDLSLRDVPRLNARFISESSEQYDDAEWCSLKNKPPTEETSGRLRRLSKRGDEVPAYIQGHRGVAEIDPL